MTQASDIETKKIALWSVALFLIATLRRGGVRREELKAAMLSLDEIGLPASYPLLQLAEEFSREHRTDDLDIDLAQKTLGRFVLLARGILGKPVSHDAAWKGEAYEPLARRVERYDVGPEELADELMRLVTE